MWSKPYRRPKPIPEPTPPGAVLDEMETEFHERPWVGASSGGMIVPNEQQPQGEPVQSWPPPPDWEEEARLRREAEQEAADVDEAEPATDAEPLPAVEIPPPPWAEGEKS